MKGCGEGKSLTVKLHPSTAKLEDRDRPTETRKAEDLHEFIIKARKIMVDELDQRFFTERPSNLRLVQIWMSKQRSADKWLPEAWHVLAKGLYLSTLRDAAVIAGIGMRSSPPRKKQKASGSTSLMRNLSEDEDEEAHDRLRGPEFDTVTHEVERWANLDKQLIKEFRDDHGIVNEFALMYKVRDQFPLHYIVFKQTASHLPHEANSEQLFSRSGDLSDDNGKRWTQRLAVWTSIAVNYSTFKPSNSDILKRCLLKYSKGSSLRLHEDDLGLLDVDATGSSDGYYVQGQSATA